MKLDWSRSARLGFTLNFGPSVTLTRNDIHDCCQDVVFPKLGLLEIGAIVASRKIFDFTPSQSHPVWLTEGGVRVLNDRMAFVPSLESIPSF